MNLRYIIANRAGNRIIFNKTWNTAEEAKIAALQHSPCWVIEEQQQSNGTWAYSQDIGWYDSYKGEWHSSQVGYGLHSSI